MSYNNFSEFNCTSPEFDAMDLVHLNINVRCAKARMEMAYECACYWVLGVAGYYVMGDFLYTLWYLSSLGMRV